MAITKVNAGDTILASQQNAIVDGIEHTTTGHNHSGDATQGMALITSGVAASRPAFGQKGRLYYSTDTDVLERDTGAAWEVFGYFHTSALGANDHHAQLHKDTHDPGGSDGLDIGTPVNIGTANAGGSALTYVRSDHVHAHPSGLGANLHHNQLHSATHSQGGGDALAVGIPSNIGTSNLAGTSNDFVRQDHQHNHGTVNQANAHTHSNLSGIGVHDHLTQASQAEIEGESNVDKYIPPDLLKHHPGIAKGWCRITSIGALESPNYNVVSVTDVGVGERIIVWNTDFSTSVYVSNHTLNLDGSGTTNLNDYTGFHGDYAVGSVRFRITQTGTATDDVSSGNSAFGDQA